MKPDHIFHDEPFREPEGGSQFDRALSIRQQVEALLSPHPAGTTIEFSGLAARQWTWANAVFDEASRASVR